MSKYKVLKDNIKNVVAQEFEKTLPIIVEEYEAKIRRQAAEITRLLAENERLKPNYENIRAKGQNEAWELARKIVLMEKEGGMKDEDYKAIFGGCQPSDYILKTHTYPEAAAKVAQWEKAKENKRFDESCDTCKFESTDPYFDPCFTCRHRYLSKYEPKAGEQE